MFNIAIDLGSKNTKGVSEVTERAGGAGRVLLKTVVAPAVEYRLNGAARAGHSVVIRNVDGQEESFFVHDLAVGRGNDAMFCLDQNITRHSVINRVLYLTAAYLLGADREREPVRLMAGLPLGVYRHQKEAFKTMLLRLSGTVSVDEGPFRRITFSDVVTFLQGAATLQTIANLPKGKVAVLGAGGHTTEVVVADVTDEAIRPVPELCTSIELGTHSVQEYVKDRILRSTGTLLDDVLMLEVMGMEEFSWQGKRVDVPALINEGRAAVARGIADRLIATMGNQRFLIRRTYISGGGALELGGMLKEHFAEPEILADAMFSDAVGLLHYGKEVT